MRRRLLRSLVSAVDGAHRWANRDRPTVLLYTDSRGQNLNSRLGKTGLGAYASRLQRRYRVTQWICPERYTTIPDFLNLVEDVGADQYDAVVMHCGIVDFSPRPLSNLARFREYKRSTPGFAELFRSNEEYYAQPFAVEYRGERTINLYSPQYLEYELLPRLRRVPRMIWINSNRFVPDWQGNYAKGRPSNIDSVVTEFDLMMSAATPSVVDLRSWSYDEIRTRTIDNIHFTRSGFEVVYHELTAAIDKLLVTDGTRSSA